MATADPYDISSGEDEIVQSSTPPNRGRLGGKATGMQTAKVAGLTREEELDRRLKESGFELEGLSRLEKEQLAEALDDSKQAYQDEEKLRELHRMQEIEFKEAKTSEHSQPAESRIDAKSKSRQSKKIVEKQHDDDESRHSKPAGKTRRRIKSKEETESDEADIDIIVSAFGETTDVSADLSPEKPFNQKKKTRNSFRLKEDNCNFQKKKVEVMEEREKRTTKKTQAKQMGIVLPLHIQEDPQHGYSACSEESDPSGESAAPDAEAAQTESSRRKRKAPTPESPTCPQSTASSDKMGSQESVSGQRSPPQSMVDVCIQASLTSTGSWVDSTDVDRDFIDLSCDSPTFDCVMGSAEQQKPKQEKMEDLGDGRCVPNASQDLFERTGSISPELDLDMEVYEAETQDMGYLDNQKPKRHGNQGTNQDNEQDEAQKNHCQGNPKEAVGQDDSDDTVDEGGTQPFDIEPDAVDSCRRKRKVAPLKEQEESISPTAKKPRLGFDMFDPFPTLQQYYEKMPLFAPPGMEHSNYTAKIVHYFEHYRVRLRTAQIKLGATCIRWDQPIVPGTHMEGSLDVYVRRAAKYPLRSRPTGEGNIPQGAPHAPVPAAVKSDNFLFGFGEDDDDFATNKLKKYGRQNQNKENTPSSPARKTSSSLAGAKDSCGNTDSRSPDHPAVGGDRHGAQQSESQPEKVPLVNSQQTQGYDWDPIGSPVKQADFDDIFDHGSGRKGRATFRFNSDTAEEFETPKTGSEAARQGVKTETGGKTRQSARGLRGRGLGRGRASKRDQQQEAEEDEEMRIDDSDEEFQGPALFESFPKEKRSLQNSKRGRGRGRGRKTRGLPRDTGLTQTKLLTCVKGPQDSDDDDIAVWQDSSSGEDSEWKPEEDRKKRGGKKGTQPEPPPAKRGRSLGVRSTRKTVLSQFANNTDSDDASDERPKPLLERLSQDSSLTRPSIRQGNVVNVRGNQGMPSSPARPVNKVECPVCFKKFEPDVIEAHCEVCLQGTGNEQEENPAAPKAQQPNHRRPGSFVAEDDEEASVGTSSPVRPAPNKRKRMVLGATHRDPTTVTLGTCPMCNKKFPLNVLNNHAATCMGQSETTGRLTRAATVLPPVDSGEASDDFDENQPLRPTKRRAQAVEVPADSSDDNLELTDNIKHSWQDFTSSDSASSDTASYSTANHHMTGYGVAANRDIAPSLPFTRISEQKNSLIDYHSQFKKPDLAKVQQKRDARLRRTKKGGRKRKRKRKTSKGGQKTKRTRKQL